MDTIKTAQELIAALKNDKTRGVYWRTGNRPAAPGMYSLGDARVYATAVRGAEKLGALKCTMNDWQSRKYCLTAKFKYTE